MRRLRGRFRLGLGGIWQSSTKWLLSSLSNNLKGWRVLACRLIVRSLSLNLESYILGDLQEFKSFGEVEGSQSIFPEFEMQDSKVVEVELRVVLSALHVDHVLP